MIGAFPPGMVAGYRYGACDDCGARLGLGPGEYRQLFYMHRDGRVRDTRDCGHEYRHGDGDVMEHCPACTGICPELVKL